MGFKLNFRHSYHGPLHAFIWFRHFEGYAKFRIAPMITLGNIGRMRFLGGVGWVCDHWDGKSGWVAPGRLGRYYAEDGTPGYQPSP